MNQFIIKNFLTVLLIVFGCLPLAEAQSGKTRPREVGATPQQPGVQIAQPNNARPNKETVADDDDVIKVDSTLVSIPVSVVDRTGKFLIDLRQQDFEIFENGKPQEIAFLAPTEQPITVALLLDTSPSSDNKIKAIRSAAQSFVRQLKPADRVTIASFSYDVKPLSDATNDRATLFRAIEKAKIKDGTAVYDAVDYALKRQLSKVEGRKAIVLFTDGVDTGSQYGTFESTVRAAQEADAVIYVVKYDTYDPERDRSLTGDGLPGDGTSREDYAVGNEYLEDLANNTGGKIFDAGAQTNLEAAFSGVAEQLRYQYSLGYYPAEPGKSGERKQIKVRVKRENVAVRARDNYVVGGGK